MTADQPPPAAVQIAEEALLASFAETEQEAARTMLAALARGGWLTPPDRVAALRAVAEAAQRYRATETQLNEVAGEEAWQDLNDALDAAPAGTTSEEAGCECDRVGPGLCFVHGPASQGTDDPPGGGGLPCFCP
jgi:hypothetical protein